MNRRHVLRGLAAGIPFFAGCNALSGGGGNNASNGTGGNATSTSGATAAATSMATTAQETATQTATATVTATTQMATETPTVATPPSTATVPAQPTTGRPTGQVTTGGAMPLGTTGGMASVDFTPLTRYSSTIYPYSVKRPANWTVDASDPTQVTFQSASGFAREGIIVSEGVGAMSLDTLVSFFNDYFSKNFDKYQVLKKRDVTLPNGNPAVVLDATISDSSMASIVLRGKYVFTIVGGTAYAVQVLAFNGAYTPTVEDAMTEIVTSLTVQGRVTSRPM